CLHETRVHRWTERTLASAEPFGCLLRREQGMSHDEIRGGGGEEHVAAALIELTGEGVEAIHRPVDLHGLGMLFEPHPTEVAGRLLGGEHPCSLAHRTRWHPRDIL